MEFEVSHYMNNDCCVVKIKGHLALEKGDEFKGYLIKILQDSTIKSILLDCEEMTNIDSNGIAVLVFAFKKTKDSNKKYALCQLNNKTSRILNMLGLDKILSIFDTLDNGLIFTRGEE
ncbi:MAG: STAS domain-containing protein [SAR324 cluster bacterium]|nr:STAS domain-containing protein [SAR324 cluster bacterium]